MMIDYWKLNKQAILDKFPLLSQDDILKALVSTQCLITLDDLAGFTQLNIDSKEWEKLAFWTYCGLHQFVHMPFGYKNSPSIFQHVMQNILALFSWIFALVYINNIIIYSQICDNVSNILIKVLQLLLTLTLH